jgi:hypothetical protein
MNNLKKRHNLPKIELQPAASMIEKEKVAVTQKEETVRKGALG